MEELLLKLKKGLQVLRHWLWLIVLVVVVFTVVLAIMLFSPAPEYQASTKIGLSTLPDRMVAAFIEVLKVEIVKQQTIDQFRLTGKAAEYDLDVKDLGNAGFLELTVITWDPNLAVLFANAHAEAAIAYYNLLQTQPAEKEKQILSEQLNQAQENLTVAERILAEFKVDHNIGELDEKLVQYERNLGALRSYIDQRLVINQPIDEIVEILFQRQEELARLNELTPDYNALENGVTEAYREYNQVLTKYTAAELAVTSAQITDKIQVIEPAEPPAKPISIPKKLFITGLFFSLGLGIGLAYVMESFFPTVLKETAQKTRTNISNRSEFDAKTINERENK
jgi:uncharacterized protein involved in exopolysaccharide biosynthesis